MHVCDIFTDFNASGNESDSTVAAMSPENEEFADSLLSHSSTNNREINLENSAFYNWFVQGVSRKFPE